MTDLPDVILRLGAAALIGGLIGLNRDIHNKPSGLRTLALVGLGAALAVMTAAGATAGQVPIAPVIQGVLTGVGFLGAGVIVHEAANQKVHGLTTAASIWLTACVGCACGAGLWQISLVSAALVAFVLVFGGGIEKSVRRRLRGNGKEGDGDGT